MTKSQTPAQVIATGARRGVVVLGPRVRKENVTTPCLVPHGRAFALCAALALVSGGAAAQEPALVPPAIVRADAVTDPRTGAGPRESVDLEIDIDREGAVLAVRAVGRAEGDPLAAAAIAAAKSFVFSPATRDGAPVPARVRHTVVFEERAPAMASFGGTVLDREKGTPIAGAEVVLSTGARTTTAADGTFRFDSLAPGPVRVTVSAEGHVTQVVDETLGAGELAETKVQLEEPADPEAFGATARIDPPPRETTRRSLNGDELFRMPGTRGDPIKAVQLLPGVGRQPFGTNSVILRGANLFDSQVFAEGAPVPLLYHFGGLSSFVHARALEAVDVYPSNFSTRYGRKLGGVIDVRLRDPKTDGLHGVLDLSLIDSSAMIETPVGDKLAVLGTFRRSNVDVFLNSARDTADLAITSAPVYWDYQSVVAFRPTEEDRIRLVAFGSKDRLALLFKKPNDVDPSIRGALDSSLEFHDVQIGWRHRFRGGAEHSTELTYGRVDTNEGFGNVGAGKFGLDTLQLRSEWTVPLSPAFRVVGGVDVLSSRINGRYTGIAQPADEGDTPIGISGQRTISIAAVEWIQQPAAYLEVGMRPIERLLLTPGVRADYNDFVGEGSIDPRLSARFEIDDKTALKGGVGRYTGHPQESRVVSPIGNPAIGLAHSTHATVGVERAITESTSVSVEGFGRWMSDMVRPTDGGRPPFYLDDQEGRVFGGEALLRMKPTGRFFGFLSYTLMRSERRDPGQPWRLFDRDTPHMVSSAGVVRLGRGWETGAAFRFTSGTPYTPIVGSSYDARTDTYVARRGAPMSDRNPPYVRLDARVEKKWTFSPVGDRQGRSAWSLAVYLDVQNVLNSPNREGFAYNYDYSKRYGASSLPILPSLGIRGEL